MLVTLTVAVLCSLLPEGGQVGRWIENLGHDNPAVRNEASFHLKAAGRAAWPDLEAAAENHPDLETRARCRELLENSRLRRRLPWRVLDEAPNAVATLRGGTGTERVALIRILARAYEETADLLLDLTQDPDPEVVIAAAEYLQERRNSDWAPRLLQFYAAEDCPRHGRAYELLTMAANRLGTEELHRSFSEAGPRGRVRLVQLSMNASLPLALSPTVLRGWLDAGDSAERRLALQWLRERGCPAALPGVEPLLSNPDAEVVAEALATLRACGWKPAADSLEALLSHEDPSVREEAIKAAVAFDESGCLPVLRRLLQDPVMSVRQSAINALSTLGGAAAKEDLWALFLRDSGESRDTAATLLRGWPEVMGRLRPLLTDPDPDRRIRGYDLWVRVDSVRVLAPLAKDREGLVRQWALQQLLRRQETPGAAEAMEGFADDAIDSIRFDALRALVRMDKRDRAAALEPFLASPDYSVRFEAAEALLTLRDERAQTLARRLLQDADAPLRRLGYFALADRNDREVADRAIRELSDPDGRLGSAAAKYLRQMLSAKRDDAVLARLASGLDRLDGEALELAFTLVLEHGEGKETAAVRALLLSGRAPRPDRAVRALADWSAEQAPALLAGLLGADASLNESVYARLREIRKRYPDAGRAELAAAFDRLFMDGDRRVRRGAVQAAGDLGLPFEGLIALVDDREPSVRSAAMTAARTLSFGAAAPRILGRLDDDDPDVRVSAALSLLALRPMQRPVVERQIAGEDCAWVKRRLELSTPGPAK
ncbi:MAG: HEAT repeat domain-containing protein [Planctomycetaceae bacterium]|nr:HEAT repeat domain-containing protein [Planctomycetaceae bacterium]